MKKIILIFLVLFFGFVSLADPAVYYNSSSNEMRELSKGLTNSQLLALAIYGESRGESLEGKIAVGSVALERADKSKAKNPLREILLKRKAFSCFNPKDPNFKVMKKIALNWNTYYKQSPKLEECFKVSWGLLDNEIPRNKHIELNNVTHYQKKGRNSYWSKKMILVKIIDNHEFYSNRKGIKL